tara:strand:+ start:187 stop:444 length:258 start_codon:yes stop_codon:yes gene_type:complete
MSKKTVEFDECDFCTPTTPYYVALACDDCGKFACPACAVVTLVEVTRGSTTISKEVVQCPADAVKKKVKKSTLDQVLKDAVSDLT